MCASYRVCLAVAEEVAALTAAEMGVRRKAAREQARLELACDDAWGSHIVRLCRGYRVCVKRLVGRRWLL